MFMTHREAKRQRRRHVVGNDVIGDTPFLEGSCAYHQLLDIRLYVDDVTLDSGYIHVMHLWLLHHTELEHVLPESEPQTQAVVREKLEIVLEATVGRQALETCHQSVRLPVTNEARHGEPEHFLLVRLQVSTHFLRDGFNILPSEREPLVRRDFARVPYAPFLIQLHYSSADLPVLIRVQHSVMIAAIRDHAARGAQLQRGLSRSVCLADVANVRIEELVVVCEIERSARSYSIRSLSVHVRATAENCSPFSLTRDAAVGAVVDESDTIARTRLGRSRTHAIWIFRDRAGDTNRLLIGVFVATGLLTTYTP